MRIALDCRSVFPGRGGIGRYAESLAKWLPKIAPDHEYLLLVTERQTAPIVSGPRITQISCSAAMIDEVWEQLHLPSLLEEHKVDLYHNPCFSLPVIRSTKWQVATVHDVIFRAHPEMVDPRLRDYLDRWTEHSLETADVILTDSEFSKQEIMRCYGTPSERVRVVYGGVEPLARPSDEVLFAVRRKYGLPERFILYVGAIEPKKNIDRLIQAFAELSHDNSLKNVKLALVGGRGGNEYDAQAAVERAGIREQVALTGYIEEEELAALMHSATLFVYPSLYEGFGLPPLEAMSCGVPTVVSDASCLPEVVGDAALIAPAENVEGLAEQMARGMKDHRLRKTLAARGHERVKTFTCERTARDIANIYQSLAGGRP